MPRRRSLMVLLAGPILLGCAAKKPATSAEAQHLDATPGAAEAVDAAPPYRQVVATALVFDLPEETYGPPLELARGRRQASAFLGFDEGISEFYSVWTDDSQRENAKYDRFERRAVSVRSGARYR